MRKSHRQKVADRKAKRRAAGEARARANQVLVNAFMRVKGRPRDLRGWKGASHTDPPKWMTDGNAWIREHAAEIFPTSPSRACPNCDGTGWSYHEHLPIERHVGCEDCGGCGDERGTGIIP